MDIVNAYVIANFHLGNGAIFWDIVVLGDFRCLSTTIIFSENLIESSLGMVINYRYEPTMAETNRAHYRNYGICSMGPEICKQ